MDVVKEILTPSKRHRAKIIKGDNGLFYVEVFCWLEEYQDCENATSGFSQIDTVERALLIAKEHLRNASGENINEDDL